MTNEILLHIGGAKCGSSALQTALCQMPRFRTTDGRRCAYVAIIQRGELLSGKDVRQTALVRPRGYVSSAFELAKFTPDQWRAMRAQFDQLNAEVAILSNEGWREIPTAIKDHLLPAFGRPARAIIYVRPQVPWLNAGWWQWGAWDGRSLSDWVKDQGSLIRWAQSIQAFQGLSGIKDVTVRLLPRDIVPDFLGHLSVQPDQMRQGAMVNCGLPAPLLRLFQRHAETLRPDRDASEIDFILSKYLEPTGTTPWVLETSLIEEVIAACRQDNLALLEMLDPPSQEVMRADPQWWDAAAFADRRTEPWHPQPPKDAELDEICAMLAGLTFRLGRRQIMTAHREGQGGMAGQKPARPN